MCFILQHVHDADIRNAEESFPFAWTVFSSGKGFLYVAMSNITPF